MLQFFSNLLSCWNVKPPPNDYDTRTLLESCIFCHVDAANGFDVIWEGEGLIAFKDHKPAAQHHVLIIPKIHIKSVRSLGHPDVDLIRSMEAAGHKILDHYETPMHMRRMGFHIPPFNTVNHLHLHVHGLPYIPRSRAGKYPISKGWGPYQKGVSWFVEVGQTIRILEQGKRIGVLPT